MKRVAIFYAVACAWSFALAGVLALLDKPHPLASTALMAAYMFGPALGAVVTAATSGGVKTLRPFVALKPNRYWLVAWLLPFALAWLTLAVSLALPGVTFSADLAGSFERMATALPPDELERARREMAEAPPILMPVMLFVSPLVAGISINALAAFGEELGWRGTLHDHWQALGFWTRSVVVGVLWGAWHAPIILQGHNYPQHPVIGVPMMILFCVLLAPLHHWLRDRGASVWTAAIFHGTFNATAGTSLLLTKGGSDLLVGATGVAGIIVLAAANVALFAVLKRGAAS